MSQNKNDNATLRAKNGSIYITLFEDDLSAPSDYSCSGWVEIPAGKYFINLYPEKTNEDGSPKLTRNGKKMVSVQFKPFAPRGDGGYRGGGEGQTMNRVPQGASDKWEKLDNSPAAYEPDIDDEIPF